MSASVVAPQDIDISILTKELEIAFADQLVKCTSVIYRELQSDHEAALQNQIKSYQEIIDLVDQKLDAFKQEMECRMQYRLDAFQKAITQALHDKMQQEVSSDSSCEDTQIEEINDFSENPQLDETQDVTKDSKEVVSMVENLAEDAAMAPAVEFAPAPPCNVMVHVMSLLQTQNFKLTECVKGDVVESSQLQAHINQLCSGLYQIGFRTNDRLLVLSTSPLRTICLVMAAWSMGGQIEFWPINFSMMPPERNRPEFAVVDSGSDLVQTKALLPFTKLISLVDGQLVADFQYKDLLHSTTPYSIGTTSTTVALSTCSYDSITSMWQYHEYSHEQLIQELSQGSSTFPPKTTVLQTLPLNTPRAMLVGILPKLLSGASICLLDSQSVAGPILSKCLSLYKPSVVIVPTTDVIHLAKVGEAIVHIDLIICMGTSVPNLPRALRGLHNMTSKFNPKLKFQRVFSTKTGIATSSEPIELPIPPPLVHSVGLSKGSGDIVIQSIATDEILGPKQVGELHLRALDNTLLRSGILAYMDTANQLHLIGSRDGILKLGAETTTALELEEIVASHPLVEDAVVICQSEPQLNLVVYVKLSATAVAYTIDALQSIQAYAMKQLPKQKQFHHLISVNCIPRDDVGHAYRHLVVDPLNMIQSLEI